MKYNRIRHCKEYTERCKTTAAWLKKPKATRFQVYFHATPTTPRKGRRDCQVSKPFNSVLWPAHGHWQLLLGKLAPFSLLQCLAVVTAALASNWDLETGSWADLSNLTEKYKSNQQTALGCIGVSRSERTLWQCSVTMVQLWAHGSLAPRTFCLKE